MAVVVAEPLVDGALLGLLLPLFLKAGSAISSFRLGDPMPGGVGGRKRGGLTFVDSMLSNRSIGSWWMDRGPLANHDRQQQAGSKGIRSRRIQEPSPKIEIRSFKATSAYEYMREHSRFLQMKSNQLRGHTFSLKNANQDLTALPKEIDRSIPATKAAGRPDAAAAVLQQWSDAGPLPGAGMFGRRFETGSIGSQTLGLIQEQQNPACDFELDL